MISFAEMEQLAATLPVPEDYFTGITGPLTTLPHTILAFARARAWLDTEQNAFHHRYVLVAPLCGQGGVILDGHLCLLAPAQALLICPYQSHYYTHLADATLHWLFFTFEYDAGDELAPLRDRRLTLTPPAQQALHAALTAYTSPRAGSERGADATLALARALTVCLQGEQMTAHAATHLLEHADARATLVGQVSRYVYAHVAEALTPAVIAAQVNLSESHLRAVFRHTVGISLGMFIRQAKIFTACQFLRTSERQVTEIAQRCGYESLFSFSRAFRQVMRQSPQQFRRHGSRPHG